jgi:hypothetical protein
VITTNGGLVTSSTPINVICDVGPETIINLAICESCYCGNTPINVTGYVSYPNKVLYDGLGITYNNTNIFYDNFNNNIGQVYDLGPYSFVWNNPAIGATSIRNEIIDNFGKHYTTSKILPKTIESSPILSFVTPQ